MHQQSLCEVEVVCAPADSRNETDSEGDEPYLVRRHARRSCDYKINGLGNTDIVDVFLTATVHTEADCQNPGGNVAPGQAFETTVSGSQLELRPENGQITSTISISASSAPDPVASQVCPNPQWTVVNVRETFVGDFNLFAVVHHEDGSTTQIDSEF